MRASAIDTGGITGRAERWFVIAVPYDGAMLCRSGCYDFAWPLSAREGVPASVITGGPTTQVATM
jgi:hypothetical protein